MLRNIDPLLSPDLLFSLRAMGHGDEIAIVDANYPAASSGQKVIRADGTTASEMLAAVLSVMPLDCFVPDSAICMQVVDDAKAVPQAVADFQCIINQTADHPVNLQSIERFAFYERANHAFAIVQTGERRLYGNIILKKGIIE